MTDVVLIQTLNDGDVIYQDGDLEMDGGIRTASYISIFGGNKKDPSLSDQTHSWWANLSEIDAAFMHRSETQYIIDNFPLIPANLLLIQDAALKDLQWFIDENIITSIEAIASIPSVNTLQLDITLDDLNLIFVEQITNG